MRGSEAMRRRKHTVLPLAAVCALAASGLPTGRWCFEGFLSVNKKARREHLDTLQGEKRTMIFYEAPHKLRQTLADLSAACGESRNAALCRELTKLHEEVIRGTLGELNSLYETTEPRGEYVIVVEGAAPRQQESMTLEQAAELARGFITGGMKLSEACKTVSQQAGVPRKELYRLLSGE